MVFCDRAVSLSLNPGVRHLDDGAAVNVEFAVIQAQAILAKYPRIDQGMRPISELLG